MMTLKIALRNIFRHKARSVITLSTIAFGCVALIFIGGFFEDLLYKMREIYIGSQRGHIQIYRRGFLENGRVEPYAYLIDNYDEIKAVAKGFPEVKSVAARLQFFGLMSTRENTISFVGQGIESQVERMIVPADNKNLRGVIKDADMGLPFIVSGRGFSLDDDYHVILGKGLAAKMKVKVNSPITILTSTIHGATNAIDVNVNGFFETAQKEFDDLFLRLPLETAQSLLDTQSVQSLVVVLYKTEDTDRIFKLMQQMVHDRNLDIELSRWEDNASFYKKTVSFFNMLYLIICLVVGIVVVLGIFNTMNMAVMERTGEIGTMMALGMRSQGVMKVFFLEGLALGCIGGVIGVVLGLGVVTLIAFVGIEMPPPPGGSFNWLCTPVISPSMVVLMFLLAVVIGGISSLFPAYRASRLQITQALRYR